MSEKEKTEVPNSNEFEATEETKMLQKRIDCLADEKLKLRLSLLMNAKEGEIMDQNLKLPFFHVIYQYVSKEALSEMDEFMSYLTQKYTATGEDNTDQKQSGSVQYQDFFIMDKKIILPKNHAEFDISSDNAHQVPYYEVALGTPLSHKQPSDTYTTSSAECFNCGSKNHIFSKCTQPRDEKRLRIALKAWRLSRQDSETRYWEEGKPGKFAVPGRLSDRLKKALNMGPNQHPPYYKRMEVYGYPPSYYLYNTDEPTIAFKESLETNDSQSLKKQSDGEAELKSQHKKSKKTKREHVFSSPTQSRDSNSEVRNDDTGTSENSNNTEYTPLQSFKNRTVYYEGLNAPDFPEPFCPPLLFTAENPKHERFQKSSHYHHETHTHFGKGNPAKRRRHDGYSSNYHDDSRFQQKLFNNNNAPSSDSRIKLILIKYLNFAHAEHPNTASFCSKIKTCLLESSANACNQSATLSNGVNTNSVITMEREHFTKNCKTF